ncbi:embryo defective 1967 [Hibiscus trionum]|uniref:Embryo defective 1967 n=1 Tax=Hibiscus trionum TaxID=183268 RepID=A0A9W7MRV5_HIBTR|nr:embryo defective 1967 [Hibiscus trionum]
MGALAPIVSTWIPEDDLLLKNAIESGASLESLAKGAVQFSRKFTIRELQDRWHSLLYDPVVSEEASSRIIEFERSAPSLPSKFCRIGNLKDSKILLGKRKSESVRSCYYALRKRIRNEPFNSMDLSFLIAPNDGNYVGIEDEPLPGNCMLGNPISNHFGVQETNMNIMNCSFPQILADDGAAAMDECATDGFQTANCNQDDDGFPVEQVNIHKDIPHMLGENQFFLESGSGIEEFHESKELSVNGLFDANDLMGKPSSAFGQINNDPENICSEFEGNRVFNSSMDCGLPIWGTDDGLPASAIPADGHGETDFQGGDIYALPSDIVAKSDHSSGHVVTTDSKLEPDIPREEVENQTADTEGYLVEITNTLMNDEPFFMDVDAKDVIDKSYFDGLSSFLASSPNNCDQDQMPDVNEAMTSETQDNLANVSCSHLGELDGVAGSCVADGSVPFDSEVPMISSVLTSNSQFPERIDGVICCTLNTEDPEIPCNEGDVFSKQLCPSVVSSTQHIFKEAGNPLSACAKDFSRGQKTSGGGTLLVQRDQRDPGQSHGSSQMKESQIIPEIGQLHPVGDCRVKCDDSPCVAPKSDGFLANGSAQINSKNISEGTLHPTLPKEKGENIIPGKHLSHCSADSLQEKPGLCSDNHNSYSLMNSFAIKQEVDAHEKAKDHQASSAKVGSMDIIFPEPVVDHPPLDLEELVIESDDDVPYFSDIEAMILDMDLDPDDQDSCDEVARYQHEDMKRANIRLEQASHSYMQRAIASHGAFAILYGRRSKYYIKKPEILLGRTTEDFVVDIDLGSEGCANKVSRRQAIINMEEDGSFHLKNLGKCSVSINGKEVAPGQSLGLTSSCLIEIRGMPFIFEMNQTCLKQYLNGKMTNSGAPY